MLPTLPFRYLLVQLSLSPLPRRRPNGAPDASTTVLEGETWELRAYPANLFWTEILTAIIGLILASAFSAIVVFAQELVPGRIGTVAGVFFGFAFGAGGIGAAMLGQLADHTSIEFVYKVASFLPAIGLLTIFLPNLEPARRHA